MDIQQFFLGLGAYNTSSAFVDASLLSLTEGGFIVLVVLPLNSGYKA